MADRKTIFSIYEQRLAFDGSQAAVESLSHGDYEVAQLPDALFCQILVISFFPVFIYRCTRYKTSVIVHIFSAVIEEVFASGLRTTKSTDIFCAAAHEQHLALLDR